MRRRQRRFASSCEGPSPEGRIAQVSHRRLGRILGQKPEKVQVTRARHAASPAGCRAARPVRQCGSRTGGERDPRRTSVAKFKIITPSGASFTGPGAGYKLEMEALAPIDAEIVEIAAKSDEDFAKEGRDADALYAKGRRITKTIIDGLPKCKVISLGSVGVDSVDVAAATARGIPVTN